MLFITFGKPQKAILLLRNILVEDYSFFLSFYFYNCLWCHFHLFQVKYDTRGFLEKNRDTLHSNLIQLLSSCSFQLPQLFASSMLSYSQKQVGHVGADCQKQSVGTKFKVSRMLLFLTIYGAGCV